MRILGGIRGRGARNTRGRGRGSTRGQSQVRNRANFTVKVGNNNEVNDETPLKELATPDQPRTIILSKTPNSDKGKGLDNIKVKSFDEIMREKKQKKLQGANVNGESGASDLNSAATESSTESIPCTVSSYAEPTPSCSVALPSRPRNDVILRRLSIPIMALKPSKHSAVRGRVGKPGPKSRTRPSSYSEVVIKQEKEDPHEENTVNNNTNGNLKWRSPIKQEPIKQEEYNLDASIDEDELLMPDQDEDGFEEYTELSETSDLLSMDYSDVPRGGSHDEDSMDEILSLHPDDSLFDIEDEIDRPTSGHRSSGKFLSSRRISKEQQDAREMLNRHRAAMAADERDVEDIINPVSETQVTDTTIPDELDDSGAHERSWQEEKNEKARTNASNRHPSPKKDRVFKVPSSAKPTKTRGGFARNPRGRGMGRGNRGRDRNKLRNGPGHDPSQGVDLKALQDKASQLQAYWSEQLMNNPLVRGGLANYLNVNPAANPLFPSLPPGRRNSDLGILGPAPAELIEQVNSREQQRENKGAPHSEMPPLLDSDLPPFEGNRSSYRRSGLHSRGNNPRHMDRPYPEPPRDRNQRYNPYPDSDSEYSREYERRNAKEDDSSSKSSGSSSPKGHSSPRDALQPEKPAPLKRQSGSNEGSGGKMAKPGNIAQESQPRSCPPGYCWSHFQAGSCSFKYCKFIHFSEENLEEYKKTGVLKPEDKSEPEENGPSAEELLRLEEEKANKEHQEKQKKYEALAKTATEELNQGNLGGACKVLETMYQLDSTAHVLFIRLLERTLFLCGEKENNPDIAAQVACKVFDMIGKVRHKYTRHDFTTLIRTLCRTGQYIRAYEILKLMKESSVLPTHEVFLDLIQSSRADPEWAFGLLEEVKALGLFRSSICSALILLSCSGSTMLDQTWKMFLDMIQCNIKPSQEAFLALINLLTTTNQMEKLLLVLKHCDNQPPAVIPPNALRAAVWYSQGKEHMVELTGQMVAKIAENGKPALDIETWNALICSCCNEKYNKSRIVQKLYPLMLKLNIPLKPMSFSVVLSSFGKANLISQALDVLEVMKMDPEVNRFPKACFEGIATLFSALQRLNNDDGLCVIAQYMIEKGFEVNEGTLVKIISKYEESKMFEQIYSLFRKFPVCHLVPPYPVMRKMFSSLEGWSGNPQAAVDVYSTMRHLYPVPPESSATEGSKSSPADTASRPRILCKFFPLGKCSYGEQCHYSHGEKSNSSPKHSKVETVPTATSSVLTTQQVRPDTIGVRPPIPFIPPGVPPRVPGPHFGNRPPMQTAPIGARPHLASAVTGAPLITHQAVPSTTAGVFPPVYPAPVGPCVPIPPPPRPPRPVLAATPQHPPPPRPVLAATLQHEAASPQPTKGPFVLKSNQGRFGFTGVKQRLGPPNNNSAVPAKPSHLNPTSPFRLGPKQVSLFSTSTPLSTSAGHLPGSDGFVGGANRPGNLHQGMARHSFDVSTAATSDIGSRGTQSAPVFSATSDQGRFQFPTSSNAQFYKPRIMEAAEEREWEELARLYVEMKTTQVAVANEMLYLFYLALVNNGIEGVGDAFSSFVAVIEFQLVNPESEGNVSPSEIFDADDQQLIGQLGVALLQACYESQQCQDGYIVLHAMHQYSINYSKYSADFIPDHQPLTPALVALIAVHICLGLQQPQFQGALEVLRGCNYALPVPGAVFTAKEAAMRSSVFEKIAGYFLANSSVAEVEELLNNVGDKNMFGTANLKCLCNELLRCYIRMGKVDEAVNTIQKMEREYVTRDSDVLRALTSSLAGVGRITAAKELFASSCLQGVYPRFPAGDQLWKVNIWTTFSKFEIQFYLERHMQLLNSHVEKQRVESQMPYDDKHFQALRITITNELNQQVPINETATKEMQEIIIEILRSDFNPPLSCGMSDKPGEVIVNPRSLRRWFLANPTSGRHKGNSFLNNDGASEAEPTHRRDVVTSYLQPGMTIRVGSEQKSRGSSEQSARQVAVSQDQEHGRREINDRVRHSICGQLTRYLREGKIATRDDFRVYARRLTEEFMRSNNPEELQRNYKDTRVRIYEFVAKYFNDPAVGRH